MRTGTALLLALLVPAVLAAQQDTTHHRTTRPRATHADTTHRNTARPARTHRQSSGGSVSLSRGNMGLTGDQVRQLQQALESDGCTPGPIDGVIGARTRRAMACARRKLGVNSSDPNALLRALNLPFTVTGHGMGPIERSGRSRGTTRDTSAAHPDTGQMSGSAMSHQMGAMHRTSAHDSAARRESSGKSGATPASERPHASIPQPPRKATPKP